MLWSVSGLLVITIGSGTSNLVYELPTGALRTVSDHSAELHFLGKAGSRTARLSPSCHSLCPLDCTSGLGRICWRPRQSRESSVAHVRLIFDTNLETLFVNITHPILFAGNSRQHIRTFTFRGKGEQTVRILDLPWDPRTVRRAELARQMA